MLNRMAYDLIFSPMLHSLVFGCLLVKRSHLFKFICSRWLSEIGNDCDWLKNIESCDSMYISTRNEAVIASNKNISSQMFTHDFYLLYHWYINH